MNFPCPLCRRMQPVQINRKQKPYLRCDSCGVLMFVNKPEGIGILHRCNKPKLHQSPVAKTAGDALFM